MSGFLVFTDGRRQPVRDGMTLGRVAGNDVVVDDTKASRKHARVIVAGGVVEIEDLGSSNGTQLNGRPVTRRVLRAGDAIQIGATVIRFEEAGAAAAGGGGSAVDDVDLFGDSTAPASPSAPPARAAPPPAIAHPAPAPSPPAFAHPAPPPPRVPPVAARAAPPPTPPPAAPPPPANVVEFEDEVVQVRASTTPARPSPPAAAGAPKLEIRQRVLQFSHKKVGTSPLGDDLAQMSGGTRALVFAIVLLAAGGIAWLMMYLVS